MGRRKVSTKADIRFLGLLFADLIGRPRGGKTFLCILGSRYIAGFGVFQIEEILYLFGAFSSF